MATGKFYEVTSMAEVASALTDKYGTGVTIYYQTTVTIIFSCPAISDKVIRFYNYTYGYFTYGDEWESGDAVTNPIVFSGTSYQYAPTARRLILLDNSFVANWVYSTASRLVIIGKLSNGKFICSGGYTNTSYLGNTNTYLTDGNIELWPISLNNIMLSPYGEIYKDKIYFASLLYVSQVNTDDSLAYLLDVSSTTYAIQTGVVTSTYYLTTNNDHIKTLNRGFLNSLLCEFETV